MIQVIILNSVIQVVNNFDQMEKLKSGRCKIGHKTNRVFDSFMAPMIGLFA